MSKGLKKKAIATGKSFFQDRNRSLKGVKNLQAYVEPIGKNYKRITLEAPDPLEELSKFKATRGAGVELVTNNDFVPAFALIIGDNKVYFHVDKYLNMSPLQISEILRIVDSWKVGVVEEQDFDKLISLGVSVSLQPPGIVGEGVYVSGSYRRECPECGCDSIVQEQLDLTDCAYECTNCHAWSCNYEYFLKDTTAEFKEFCEKLVKGGNI